MHLVRCCGACLDRARALHRPPADTEPAAPPPAGESSPKERSTWARLLSQVYEVEPSPAPGAAAA